MGMRATKEAGTVSPRMLIRVKLVQLACVAKEGLGEVAGASCDDASVRTPWLQRVIARWVARNSPQTRLRSGRVVLRVRIFRSLTRFRAAFNPHWMACSLCDH